jgi:hypothetical protein
MTTILLPESRAAWHTPGFAAAIKAEVACLGAGPAATPAPCPCSRA